MPFNVLSYGIFNSSVSLSSSSVSPAIDAGEYVVGLTYEDGAVKLLADGSTAVEMRYPTEGSSASAFAGAVIKGAKNMKAAKALVDFVCSAEGQTKMSEYMEGTLRFTNTKMKVSDKSWLCDSSDIKWVNRPVKELTDGKEAILNHWNELIAKVQK